jgi:hypothetical protein
MQSATESLVRSQRGDAVDRRRFWEIIDASRRKAGGSQGLQLAALEAQLRALAAEEVASFDEHFSECVARADCNDVYAAAAIIDGFWVSDDAFTYFLEWLISQGETAFENAVRHPDSLAGVVEKGEVCEFEGFGYVAARVWEEKTGRSAEGMPGQVATKAIAPDGAAWKDDEDLKRRFPRLWEKFSSQGE